VSHVPTDAVVERGRCRGDCHQREKNSAAIPRNSFKIQFVTNEPESAIVPLRKSKTNGND